MATLFVLEYKLRLLFRNGLSLSFVLLICLCGATSPTAAETTSTSEVAYRLRLFHIHTGHRLDIVYRHGDTYDPDALARLNHYLGDHRTGTIHEYDPRI